MWYKMDYKLNSDYVVYMNGSLFYKKTMKFVKPFLDKTNGYIKYTIYHNVTGKKMNVYLHRVLGLTFLPNFQNYPLISHKDGNKQNNSLFNLMWDTASNNLCNMNDPLRMNNTSGVRGVSYHTGSEKWRAKLTKNKKTYDKFFKYYEDAVCHRICLEQVYF